MKKPSETDISALIDEANEAKGENLALAFNLLKYLGEQKDVQAIDLVNLVLTNCTTPVQATSVIMIVANLWEITNEGSQHSFLVKLRLRFADTSSVKPISADNPFGGIIEGDGEAEYNYGKEVAHKFAGDERGDLIILAEQEATTWQQFLANLYYLTAKVVIDSEEEEEEEEEEEKKQ